MRYYSPLRYPGGKGRLAPFIRQVFIDNAICEGTYIEPYAGGAAIALELVMTGYAKEAWINDIDPAIYAFWHSALNESSDLIKKVKHVPLTISEWHRQRKIYIGPKPQDSLSLGFATLFLNRVNRSGILNAGVIGGLSQTGNWLIDARFNRDELIDRLYRLAQYRHRIHLFNLDAEQFLKETPLPKRSLVYMDPPYFHKAQRLYRNHYAEADHSRIAELALRMRSTHWIVSYDDAPEILRLYPKKRFIRYALNYSAQDKRSGAELMFFSNRLKYPDTNNPALFQKRA
ncbi:MAG: DNA methyltransferase [Candidatus Nitrospira kreftii]|uniref:site-specific DNA-methyltransferase (adenine-specific) n=1 Tax=Candidatus Nitrospira kreftii TaxID=2652173 RepID=A0A7S8J0L6_9BACT|nr:MAG: DNA methyltransferase [Candidatus Nitrospira kreftii]